MNRRSLVWAAAAALASGWPLLGLCQPAAVKSTKAITTTQHTATVGTGTILPDGPNDASVKSMLPPIYPSDALEKGVHGEVQLVALIGVTGNVAAIGIKYSSGYESLDDSAATDVLSWHFSPRIRNGVAVASIVTIPVQFGASDRSRTDEADGSDLFVEVDRPEIARIQQAAAGADAEAEYLLGSLYRWGLGVRRDPALALKWQQEAAKQGIPEACASLADIFAHGVGVPKDVEKAIAWYEKAAPGGNGDAEYQIAQLYANRESSDPGRARTWFDKAAARSNPRIMLMVARIYGLGTGVPRDTAAVQRLLEAAARSGSDDIKDQVASSYMSGDIVPKDSAKAISWLELAAAHDDGMAEALLGVMYEAGVGVDKDPKAAAGWFQKSAAQGNLEGQGMMTGIYMTGLGVPRDLVLASAWKILVNQHDPRNLGSMPDSMMRMTMSPAQEDEATRIAAKWVKGESASA